LKQFRERVNVQPEILDDAAQCLSFDGNTAVHWDHNSCMIGGTDVDGMATRLSSELKPEALCDAGYFFARE
jgi:hypothetical protein